MHPNWRAFFARLMQVEVALTPIIPIFVHSPVTQQIVAAVLVAEDTALNSIFGSGQSPDPVPTVPTPLTVPTSHTP